MRGVVGVGPRRVLDELLASRSEAGVVPDDGLDIFRRVRGAAMRSFRIPLWIYVSRVPLAGLPRFTHLECCKIVLHLCEAGAAHGRDRGESLVLRQTREVRNFDVVGDGIPRALRGVRRKLEAIIGNAVRATSCVLRVVPVRVEPLEEVLPLLADTLEELAPDLRALGNGDPVERLYG